MASKLISKQKYTGDKSDTALKNALITISKANPNNAVMVGGQFGELTIYIYKSLSSIPVDSPVSRSMIFTYSGLAFVNGKISQPTKGWARKQILTDKAIYGK